MSCLDFGSSARLWVYKGGEIAVWAQLLTTKEQSWPVSPGSIHWVEPGLKARNPSKCRQ